MGSKVKFTVVDISRDAGPALKYQVQSTPTYVIVDGSGDVAATLGISDKAEVKAAIEKVLPR